MRRALARADLGAVVAILRAAANLSQLDLANLVDGWSQSTVSLIERGLRDTLYDLRELLRFADAVGMPRHALLPLVLGDPDAMLEKDGTVQLQGAVMNLDRRAFHEMMAGLIAVAAVPMLRVPDRVDMAHVRYLRASLQQIRTGSRSAGGATVIAQAQSHFTWARRLLEDADYSETVGRSLLAVAAELGVVAGWVAYDSNDQQLARRLYSEAELLAGSCADAVVQANLYTTMAQQSTHLASITNRPGIAREALRFTARAAEVTRREPSPRLHALISLRTASAHAQLGDELAFRQAITAARHELDRGPTSTDPPWATFVTDTEITGFEGLGYEALASHQDPDSNPNARAVALYHQVLEDPTWTQSPDRDRRAHVAWRARLARALLQHGDLPQALNEGAKVLPATSGVTSVHSLTTLQPLRRAAEKNAAEEFCQHYDAAVQALPA